MKYNYYYYYYYLPELVKGRSKPSRCTVTKELKMLFYYAFDAHRAARSEHFSPWAYTVHFDKNPPRTPLPPN